MERDKEAGIFHVWSHSVWTSDFFRSDLDRVIFLRELVHVGAQRPWTCLAFCLLTAHYHLLLDVGRDVMPRGMQVLNFRYAQGFNGRHHLRGHVVGGRYGSRRIDDDADLLNAFRYVARNPIEAGLCVHPADWPWSSYAGTVGLAEPDTFVDPGRVLAGFDCPRDVAIARLREFVEKPWARRIAV